MPENPLEHYFTSVDKPVFALRNMPDVVAGTLFSRYSRSPKDLRRLFVDEFMQALPVLQELTGVNEEKAEDFYRRVLVGYGDDSVAELGGAHVAVEGITMLATKAIEEHRIGLSPLEKSTRYVYFDRLVDGRYNFYTPPVFAGNELYEQTTTRLFETYAHIVRDVQPALEIMFPQGDAPDAAYRASIRAKACDIARHLLPLSARTNMGIYGNGRAFEYLISNLLGDQLPEVQDVGQQLSEALGQVIPVFIERATSERGDQYRKYSRRVEQGLAVYASMEEGRRQKLEPGVRLTEWDRDAIDGIIAAVLFEQSGIGYEEGLRRARRMEEDLKNGYLRAMTEPRTARQHKVFRYAEQAVFGFEIVSDWGVYKDLMRHRIATRFKKTFSSEYGYFVPPEIDGLGYGDIYREVMDQAQDVQVKLAQSYPAEAQYLVTHGSLTPFYMRMNLREIIHLCELRSTPQGHPTYRKVAQDIAIAVKETVPALGRMLKFVDYNDYELERLAAFRKAQARGYEFPE